MASRLFLVAGKVGRGWRIAELLQQFSPFLAFRSSSLQKVASSNPVTDEGVRRGQSRNLSSEFSLQVDDQLLLLLLRISNRRLPPTNKQK